MDPRPPELASAGTDAPVSGASESEIVLALLEPGDPELILERALGRLGPQLPFEWAGLIHRQGAGGTVVGSWVRGPDGRLGLEPEAAKVLRAFDLPGQTSEGALPIDWGQPMTQTLSARGYRRVLLTPLGGAPGAERALMLALRSDGAFRPRGKALLGTLAAPLGAALVAAQRGEDLHRRVEERTRELTILFEASRTIGTTLEAGEIMPRVMEALHALLDFDLGVCILDDAGGPELTVHVASPISEACRRDAGETAREALRAMAGRVPRAMEAQVRPLAVFEPGAALVPDGALTRTAAPIALRGQIVGAIVVMSRRPGAFGDSHARLLQTIALQAGAALERVRAFQQKEEVRLQAVIDSISSGLLVTDRDFKVSFANPAARRALEILAPGAEPGGTIAGLGGVPIAEIAAEVVSRGAASAQREVRTGDTRRIYSVGVSAIGSPGPMADGIVFVLSDVTEARLMEEQLRQSEKLSAIGEMISGVAHELNNPLAAVMGFAQLLQGARVRDDVRRKLAMVYSEAQRCQRVVQNLLTFARKHKPERRLVDVGSALDSVIALLTYQLRVDGVKVRTSFSPTAPGIHGDYHQLQQVFLNIVNNAHQAMQGSRPEERSLTMILEPIASEPGLRSFTGVRVEIQDTGPGISPENLKRIFDPFFTTKQTGQGTGLGLSLAYGTVTDHGGRIYARSQLGHGTTFVIELPRGEAPVAAPAEIERSSGATASAPMSAILVVDDEPAIATMIRVVLEGAGHRVEIATDGRAALERIRRGNFDLVISDLKMPHMDGRALYEAIREHRPALARRMLFSTGDAASADTQAFLETSRAPVLVKPFDLDDLKREVARLLESAGA